VTGVTQDIGSKSTGSETITTKLSHCIRGLIFLIYAEFLFASFVDIRSAVKQGATSKGTRQEVEKGMVDEDSAICKCIQAPKASATRITTLNIQRIFRAILPFPYEIELVNNTPRVRNIVGSQFRIWF